MSDAQNEEILKVSWQIGMLLKENKVSYDVAVPALCVTAKQIATCGWSLDEAAANANFRTALLH